MLMLLVPTKCHQNIVFVGSTLFSTLQGRQTGLTGGYQGEGNAIALPSNWIITVSVGAGE